MYLRVSPQTGMWGFGDELWFTFADPEPQEVDYDALDADSQNAVDLALANGQLHQFDENGKKIKARRRYSIQTPIAVEPVKTDVKAQIAPSQLNGLKQLLKGGVTSIRRQVALIKTPSVLRAAIELEDEGKKRSTVSKLLKGQLKKVDVRRTSTSMNPYDALVKEEIGETITFQVERISLTEEPVTEEDKVLVVGKIAEAAPDEGDITVDNNS